MDLERLEKLAEDLRCAGNRSEGIAVFGRCASEIGCSAWAFAEMRRSEDGGFVLDVLATPTGGVSLVLTDPADSPMRRMMTRTWRSKEPLTWRTAPGEGIHVVGEGVRRLLGCAESEHVGVLPMPCDDPSRRSYGFAAQKTVAVIAEYNRAAILFVDFLKRLRREANLPMRIDLSRREIAVLQSCALGRKNEAIATDLGLSTHTVRQHLDKAREKLGGSNLAHTVALAMRARLIR